METVNALTFIVIALLALAIFFYYRWNKASWDNKVLKAENERFKKLSNK